MRVLHLDAGLEMRGGQWQVLYLLEGLAAARCDFTLLAPASAPLRRAAAERGWDVRPLTKRAVRALSRQSDLTHAHDAHSHSLAALLARPPLVVSRRVAFPMRGGALSRWKYARAVQYLAVSQAVAAVLEGSGVPRDRISVVYDGVPPRESAAGGPLVLALDSGDPRKGSALLRQTGVDIYFTRDLATDIDRAAVFVYATEQEGLGSAALLAMSAGVPVIASRVGGLPEIVEHEVTGLLVDNDAAVIAAAIRRLLNDEALARRLAGAARQRVLEQFSTDVMVRRTLELYRGVLT